MPDGWFVGAPAVLADREEIVVVGRLPEPEAVADGSEGPMTREAAIGPRIGRAGLRTRVAAFREDTREQRMQIADEAEMLWGRKVSWGACCGAVEPGSPPRASR